MKHIIYYNNEHIIITEAHDTCILVFNIRINIYTFILIGKYSLYKLQSKYR